MYSISLYFKHSPNRPMPWLDLRYVLGVLHSAGALPIIQPHPPFSVSGDQQNDQGAKRRWYTDVSDPSVLTGWRVCFLGL